MTCQIDMIHALEKILLQRKYGKFDLEKISSHKSTGKSDG